MKNSTKVKGIYPVKTWDDRVLAVFSGREFNEQRRGNFFNELEIPAEKIASLGQVHSSNIVRVSGDKVPGPNCMADGMVTNEAGLALSIRTADCIPVFFWSPEKEIVGIAHAGWRGIHHNIAGKMILVFTHNFGVNPGDIKVAFGPGIRKKHYEVGEEFKELFPEHFEPFSKTEDPEKTGGLLDLTGVVRDQVAAEGISAKNIVDCGYCTYGDNNRFFSHRRENATTERIVSVIMLKSR